ncbi:MAG: LysR family transcriptional regulator [Pseudomonadales bacterium]
MENRLSKIDLNLLIALEVLLEERSVTRAAGRLFITQPAMSKTLQRLRDLFNDPLFTRTAHGLVPTPKAVDLQQPLIAVLEQLESTIFEQEFEPAQAEGRIRICIPEILALGGIPALLQRFSLHAPNLRLQSRNILDDQLELLANGGLDFSIYVRRDFDKDIEVFPLSTFNVSCWFRRNHPLASKPSLSVADLAKYPHVSLYLPNITDEEISRLERPVAEGGLGIKPIFETTQLLVALEGLKQNDAIMLGPPAIGVYQVAKGLIVTHELQEIPLVSEFNTEVCLLQHRRTLSSPLHRWVREQITEIFQSL